MSTKKSGTNLRSVAERVGLAPCSVSAVLNNTPASLAIPQRTKDRIFRAVGELNYRPNFWARSLRTKRTRMIAAITSDIGRAPAARVIAGAQSLLHRSGYLLIVGAFDCAVGWDNLSTQLRQRGIEGVIAIDVTLPRDLDLPVASVDLQDMRLLEPLSNGLKISLSKLGESAAETVLRRIERKAASPKLKLVPKPPNTYFDSAQI